MWPGQQQPGGPQYPQQPPQNQPPWQHQPPSPYQPHQHPAYQQPPQTWGPQPPPGGPNPPGGRRGVVVAVSVVAAVAVIATGVLVAVKLTGDDGKRPQAGPSASGSPLATATASDSPSPTPSVSESEAGPGPDDARGNPGEDTVKPVVAGWQTVVRSDMGVAYDVPKGWTVKPTGLLIGYEWDGNRVVTGGAALLDEKWCGTDERGLAGVKGGKGAKSLKSAAANEAYNWAYAKYNEAGDAKLTETAPRAYTNAQGVRGWTASTRATGMKGECAADGTSYSFTFLDKHKEVRSWLLIVDRGYAGAPDTGTVDRIRDSVRLVG